MGGGGSVKSSPKGSVTIVRSLVPFGPPHPKNLMQVLVTGYLKSQPQCLGLVKGKTWNGWVVLTSSRIARRLQAITWQTT